MSLARLLRNSRERHRARRFAIDRRGRVRSAPPVSFDPSIETAHAGCGDGAEAASGALHEFVSSADHRWRPCDSDCLSRGRVRPLSQLRNPSRTPVVRSLRRAVDEVVQRHAPVPLRQMQEPLVCRECAGPAVVSMCVTTLDGRAVLLTPRERQIRRAHGSSPASADSGPTPIRSRGGLDRRAAVPAHLGPRL